ncbi:uncharacterized protein [Pyxicephalus adspersus]|uniref:uncharacterized protein isoform X2 n=1 Tax=Pyxicephalus adspersus TaxID=30357 RepID=UPI003B5BA055
MALHHRLSPWQKILMGLVCFPLLPIYLCVYCLCLKKKEKEDVGGKQKDSGDVEDSTTTARNTSIKLSSTNKVKIEKEIEIVNQETQKPGNKPVSKLDNQPDLLLSSNKENVRSKAHSQKNKNASQHRQKTSSITYSYPWDNSNLKSLQVDLKTFDKLDLHAAKVNANGTLEQLVKELVHDANTELEKIRAFWIWICHHIEYDTAGFKNKALAAPDPDVVLQTRKGTSNGYCSLFERMCSLADIQCKTVSGFSKGASYKAGQTISGDADHTWNMVYLEGRWHLLDTTWGAGYVDENISKFTFQYNEFYFFTHPALFIGEHYPEQADCQLLYPNVTRKDFEQIVHHRSHFYNLGLISSQPAAAVIQTVKGKATITIESKHKMLYIFSINDTEDTGLLRLMEHEAKIDVYPPKTGQHTIQIYAKRPDLVEAYQLVVDYRIDCKTVDSKIKMPKCLHNPAGPSWLSEESGLLHQSHEDPVIYTEDGCCTISFTTIKVLRLTANLRSDEVKSILNHIIQRVQDKKVEFSVHLPQAGTYVLQIFEGSKGFLCNYLIICENTKVKWPPYPEVLHNPVGPNPKTGKAGLLHPSHLEPVIQQEDGCCTISFQTNGEIKVSSSLKSDKMQVIMNQILQRMGKDKVEFTIRLPQYGSYVFQIFGENKGLICNYLIRCSNPTVKWPPFPSMLHNPVGPNPDIEVFGLHQPSHSEPVIHTEDGRFTITFTTDRALNLRASLKSDDVQIAPNVMHILQTIQKQKLEFNVRLPGAGSYVFQIFDEIAGYICNYLVICSNLKVKWPPFPSSLHNPVGPNPETEKAGLIQPSHPDPMIHTEDGCCIISFALMRDLSIFPTLHSDDVKMMPEMEHRHVFQRKTQGNLQIKVHLPQSGTFVLHVNIMPKNSNMYKHQCNYLITCTNTAVKWPMFPLVYTDWSESYELVQPLEGVLHKDSDVLFKLQIPEVAGVRVKGKGTFPLTPSEDGYWEGTCNTANCKYMYVCISSKDKPETWTFILQYLVGDRTP